MEARLKGRGGKGSRNDVELLRTGLLRKDLKELKSVGCSWVGEGQMGRTQMYSQGIRSHHCNFGSVLVWSWKRIQGEWLIGPSATLSGEQYLGGVGGAAAGKWDTRTGSKGGVIYSTEDQRHSGSGG
jgi:hypothetical protein